MLTRAAAAAGLHEIVEDRQVMSIGTNMLPLLHFVAGRLLHEQRADAHEATRAIEQRACSTGMRRR